jgi:hypothetical protein
LPEFEQKYVNEDHMEAFRNAIEANAQNEPSAELISAVTDFMPVQQTTSPTSSKRARQRKSPRRYNGYSYTLLRIPLMVKKKNYT